MLIYIIICFISCINILFSKKICKVVSPLSIAKGPYLHLQPWCPSFFSPVVIKKFHTSFGFRSGLEFDFFSKGDTRFSLSLMIILLKKNGRRQRKLYIC